MPQRRMVAENAAPAEPGSAPAEVSRPEDEQRTRKVSPDLSPADELRTAIQEGLAVKRSGGKACVEGRGWGEDRHLPAELLYELLTRDDGGLKPRAAVLVGLRITGRLHLEGAELHAPLIAHNCYFDNAVNLIGATAPSIQFTNCCIPGVDAEELETRGSIDLSGSTLKIVNLLGAQIRRQLDLRGVTFTGGSYPLDLGGGRFRPAESGPRTTETSALRADDLEVRGAMLCGIGEDGRRFTAEGEVRLPGAHIGGQLRFSGAQFTNRSDVALRADGLQVDGDMFCGVSDDKQRFTAEGEVRLLGAHVRGMLAFTGAKLRTEGRRALSADGVRVDRGMSFRGGFVAAGEVSLIGAHIGGQLTLAGATLRNDSTAESGPALNASGLQVDGDVFFSLGEDGQRFTTEGEVTLVGAKIGGQLTLAGATLTNKSGPALDAAGLRVDQRMLCTEGFSATGEIRLPAAQIGGQLSLAGATLTNKSGPALNAAGLRADQRMLCTEGFSATGEIRLPGAHIGGRLDFGGARLTNPSGPALSAERAQVEGDMFCGVGKDGQRFTTNGEISLSGASISGQLTFADGTLCRGRVALRLEDAKLRALSLQFAEAPPGEVDLRGARVERFTNRLYDPPLRWVRCRLRGYTYESLHTDAQVSPKRCTKEHAISVEDRLSWLSADPEGYSPQPYEQLAGVYRASGDDEAARQVLIAKQRRLRGQTTLGRPAKLWSWFLDVTVVYGYRLWRAGFWLIVLAVVGSVLFGNVFHAAARGPGDLTPSEVANPAPPFQPVLYTVDVLLPVVSLGQETAWNAHGAAQWITAIGTLLGWLLTTALVAGLIIRRE